MQGKSKTYPAKIYQMYKVVSCYTKQLKSSVLIWINYKEVFHFSKPMEQALWGRSAYLFINIFMSCVVSLQGILDNPVVPGMFPSYWDITDVFNRTAQYCIICLFKIRIRIQDKTLNTFVKKEPSFSKLGVKHNST